MAIKKQQYLQWHGQQWRVRVKVSPRALPVLGKTVLTQALHTSDLEKANRDKWAVVTAFKDIIAKAERGQALEYPIEAEALSYRAQLAARGDDLSEPLIRSKRDTVSFDDINPNDIVHDELTDEITHRAYEIEKQQDTHKAKRFADITFGRETPLTAHLDDYLAFKGYPKKTGDILRRGLSWLTEWQSKNNRPHSINVVTVREVARFIPEKLLDGRGHKTAQLHMTMLRGYWDWLIERQYYTSKNPWEQRLPARPKANRDAEEDGEKRPYTDSELASLIYGETDKTLSDVMLTASLSGMRIEEICQLRVKDCLEGLFKVRGGKTANAKRIIPVHSSLKAIVAARTLGAIPESFFISELPIPPLSRTSRSDPLVKRFVRYRRKMGVDERPNEKLKSNVDFHSFRRWFIRKARDRMLEGGAGFDGWTIVALVGHSDRDKPQGEMTMSTYAGTDSIEHKRLCVEAITLPKPKEPIT